MGEDVSVGIGLDAAAPQFRKRAHMKEMVVQLAALAAEHVPGLNVGASVDFDLPELHRTTGPGPFSFAHGGPDGARGVPLRPSDSLGHALCRRPWSSSAAATRAAPPTSAAGDG